LLTWISVSPYVIIESLCTCINSWPDQTTWCSSSNSSRLKQAGDWLIRLKLDWSGRILHGWPVGRGPQIKDLPGESNMEGEGRTGTLCGEGGDQEQLWASPTLMWSQIYLYNLNEHALIHRSFNWTRPHLITSLLIEISFVCNVSHLILWLNVEGHVGFLFFENYIVQNRRPQHTHAHSPLWIHVHKPNPYEHLRRTKHRQIRRFPKSPMVSRHRWEHRLPLNA
jgi:hypothetical protein